MWIPFSIFVVLWFLSIEFYMPVAITFVFLTAALLILTAWLLLPSERRS